MYANLRVTFPNSSGRRRDMFAHEVEILEDGTIRVHKDKNDGESSYAEPDGVKDIPPGTPVRITADF